MAYSLMGHHAEVQYQCIAKTCKILSGYQLSSAALRTRLTLDVSQIECVRLYVLSATRTMAKKIRDFVSTSHGDVNCQNGSNHK